MDHRLLHRLLPVWTPDAHRSLWRRAGAPLLAHLTSTNAVPSDASCETGLPGLNIKVIRMLLFKMFCHALLCGYLLAAHSKEERAWQLRLIQHICHRRKGDLKNDFLLKCQAMSTSSVTLAVMASLDASPGDFHAPISASRRACRGGLSRQRCKLMCDMWPGCNAGGSRVCGCQ